MTEPSYPERLAGMISGYWTSQAVYVAAKLGIADLLADGPKSIEELATATGTHPRSLYRLLRALASAGEVRPLADPTPTVFAASRRADPLGPRLHEEVR